MGRRKTSTARAVIKPGKGDIFIKGKELVDYFVDDRYRESVLHPFYATGTLGMFDAEINPEGGGLMGAVALNLSCYFLALQQQDFFKTNTHPLEPLGQSDAIKLAIARALQNFNPDFRPALKSGKRPQKSTVLIRVQFMPPYFLICASPIC